MQAQVPRPTSRLSPPPGADLHDLLAASAEAGSSRKDDERAPKRGYRACAKCDLGDVNAPSEPPCSRCRREQRNCVFLPSKRRRRTLQDDGTPDLYTAAASGGHAPDGGAAGVTQPLAIPASDMFRTPSLAFGGMDTASNNGVGSVSSQSSWLQPPTGMAQSRPQTTFAIPSAASANSSIRSHLWSDTLSTMLPDSKPSPLFDPPTGTSHPESSTTVTTTSPTSGSLNKRRRLTTEPDSTRKIVTASFNNETDALEILASAATDEDGNPVVGGDKSRNWEAKPAKADARLEEFVLIRRGVLSADTLEEIVRVFFERHHPVQPIFQTMRIPHTRAQLATIASVDPFFLSCIVIVVSRHHPAPGMKDIHDQAYTLVRETIAEYTCAGLQPTIGFVEGVLLLAENLPREKAAGLVGSEMIGGAREGDGLHGIENRRSWALTGVAIRAAYGIGLDQTALEDGERTGENERARSVWTWCYLYDRSIGLAFWSRGPNICFNGYSNISQTGEAAALVNFPHMLARTGDASPSPRLDVADSASLMQAQLELTQIMTNAHDILFSTRARTAALVKQGEYFKFLDHFRRALDGFRAAWRDKQWNRDDARELTWCTFHTARLYVAAFAFQAHVQRAQERAEKEREEGRNGVVSLFPRGSATSPDALFIYDSIEAAHEILNICVRLGQADVLRYLPSRYLINFAYSGTFALKAAYSGAMSRRDATKTRELVDKVCAALILACSDKDHAAGRYGQMLRILHRRLEELNDASAVPSRFPSPEPLGATDDALLSSFLPPNSADPVHAAPAAAPGPSAAASDAGLFDLGPGAAPDAARPFNFDLDPEFDLGFRLDGFWEDFTLTDSGGFPFR